MYFLLVCAWLAFFIGLYRFVVRCQRREKFPFDGVTLRHYDQIPDGRIVATYSNGKKYMLREGKCYLLGGNKAKCHRLCERRVRKDVERFREIAEATNIDKEYSL